MLNHSSPLVSRIALWVASLLLVGAALAEGVTAPPPAPPAPPPPPANLQAQPASSPGDEEVGAGLKSLQAGDLSGARAHFEKALALDPNHQFARAHLAYIKFRRADYAAAAVDAEAAVQLDPADSLADVILGRCREALGDPARALAAYTTAIEQGPNARSQERARSSLLARYLRAMLRINRGEAADVESDLKEVLRGFPKHAYAQYELALFYLKTNRTAEAVEAFRLAEEVVHDFQPQESWIYPSRRYFFLEDNLRYWSGVALRQGGKPDDALAKFEPLLGKVDSMAGSTLTQKGSGAAAGLEGQIETSFYNVHYEAALACESKADKGRAQSLIKTMLKLNLADAETQRQAKELQKRLK